MFMYLIYKHTNTINGKSYIGLTKETMQRRWIKHKACSRFKDRNSYNLHFMRAIRKYPYSVWTHKILESGISKEEVSDKEIYYIELHSTFYSGYNSCKGGITRMEVSKETRKKLSVANKGRKHSPNVCEAAQKRNSGSSNPMYGKSQGHKTKDAVSNRRRSESDPTLRTWINKNGTVETDITCLGLCDKYPELLISKLNAVAKGLKNKEGYRIGVSHKGWSVQNAKN